MDLPTAKDGLQEIRACQMEHNKKIANAPIKPGYNNMTNTKISSKYEWERAKFNAVKAIIQDYAVFQIHLLSDEELAKLKPKEESTGSAYVNELRA